MNSEMTNLDDSVVSNLEQAISSRFSKKEAREWVRDNAMSYREMLTYYNCAMMQVETKLRVLNEDLSLRGEGNPIESIKARLKSPESLLEKIIRYNVPLSVESIEKNIHDIAGLRVICSFESDIYKLADSLLQQDDITLIQRKDYIAKPKANGYRSLHLILAVPIFLHDEKRYMHVEVQLRTLAMDLWASLEHKLRYKKETAPFEPALSDELKLCADMTAELDARMLALRNMVGKEQEEKKSDKSLIYELLERREEFFPKNQA